MKNKRIILLTIICLMIFSSTAFAFEKKAKSPMFMGEVLEVQRSDEDEVIRIKVKGYIKGCEVYNEELVGIINEYTLIAPNDCMVKKSKANWKKVDYDNFKIEKGDTVFMILNEAMTKSIPPQVVVKAIQITGQN